jgi:peptide/nickel transport system permease protein
LYGILVLLGIVLLVFMLFAWFPDPAEIMAGQRDDVLTKDAIKKELGLDKSKGEQLLLYINDLSPLSFHQPTLENQQKYNYTPLFTIGNTATVIKSPYLRRSYQSKKKVSSILAESFIGTLVLALASILIASIIGIFLGIWAALKQDTFADRSILFISTIGISVPSFFASIIIAWLFGYILTEYTGLNMTGSLVDYDSNYNRFYNFNNLILPALALGIRPLAIIIQLTRSSMIDVMGQDYIRTAYAKGLSNVKVIWRHAIKNALNPVITSISGWFASLLAGSFFVEYIFNWRGIGKVTVDALEKSDYPVVMGAILLIAVIFILINIIVDIVYKLLDPRVKIS